MRLNSPSTNLNLCDSIPFVLSFIDNVSAILDNNFSSTGNKS